MIYISSFTYCDSIQTDITEQGIRHQVMNPLQLLNPVALPSNYSFAIECNIVGFDPREKNNLRVIFLTENGDVVHDTKEIEFSIPSGQTPNDHLAMMQFNLDFRNLVLRKNGTYKTEVFVNEELIGTYMIPVIVGENNGKSN